MGGDWMDLQSLIQSIFHPVNLAAQAQANATLLAFTDSKEAWYGHRVVSLLILSSPSWCLGSPVYNF